MTRLVRATVGLRRWWSCSDAGIARCRVVWLPFLITQSSLQPAQLLSHPDHGWCVSPPLRPYKVLTSTAIYAVYTSPTHPPVPNHLPTLIVTPHGTPSAPLLVSHSHLSPGQPTNILYSYLHTNYVRPPHCLARSSSSHPHRTPRITS